MTPEEVCDAVFGEWTKDGPTIRPSEQVRVSSSIPHEWGYWFEGPRPDWFLPWPGRDEEVV